MASVVVDASVWASYLLPADPFHHPSRQWLVPWLTQKHEVVGPVLLLVEVASAIARRTGRPRLGRRAIRTLRQNPQVRLIDLDESLAVVAATLAVDLGIRGADAVYVAVAHRLSLPLVTWDQEQLTRGAAVVQTRTP